MQSWELNLFNFLDLRLNDRVCKHWRAKFVIMPQKNATVSNLMEEWPEY